MRCKYGKILLFLSEISCHMCVFKLATNIFYRYKKNDTLMIIVYADVIGCDVICHGSTSFLSMTSGSLIRYFIALAMYINGVYYICIRCMAHWCIFKRTFIISSRVQR